VTLRMSRSVGAQSFGGAQAWFLEPHLMMIDEKNVTTFLIKRWNNIFHKILDQHFVRFWICLLVKRLKIRLPSIIFFSDHGL
jgi:hypothetical protein